MIYFSIKTLKNVLKVVNSQAAPWQVFIGSFLGTLLGFLPIFPLKLGPSPLGIALVLVALIVNCHLGSVMLFFALGWLLAKLLTGPAVLIGDQFSGLAQTSSRIPFLDLSLWSHTGYLGLTVLGLAFAVLFAVLMWRFTIYFRTTLRDRLVAKRKLLKVGKVGGNLMIVRLACWFFDL